MGEMEIDKYDILTVADLCVDIVVSGQDVFPEFGQKEKLVDSCLMELGGSCSIFACQAAKLGLKTGVIGVLGDDFFGNFMLERLRESGVCTDHVRIKPGVRTASGVAIVRKGGDRAILTDMGSIDHLTMDDIPLDVIAATRHLHIGSFYLIRSLKKNMPGLAKFAKERGITVSLDTNWDPQERWDDVADALLPAVDVCFPNSAELKAIFREDVIERALELAEKNVPVTALKLGEDGAMLKMDGQTLTEPALKIEYADDVGAGDNFDAGFLYGFLHDWSMKDCLRCGCFCGAMSTTKSGGTAGQPLERQMLEYIGLRKQERKAQ
jgi:sugar/nucleoside kinase (ribokinase family)